MNDSTRFAPVWEACLDDRYQVLDLVGSGAIADVYRARDVRLDRTVAVKVFRSDHDPVARRRFVGEAHALARLSHPGLVPIFDAGADGERPYLVMRLVEGGSLRERLLSRPLGVAETVDLGVRLADVLAHVHQRGLVHRDVKPSNILLDRYDRAHLVDFGIALTLGAARLTAANEIVGSAAYLAPEQVRGERIGWAVDVYALGLVLIEALTGELVYPGSHKIAVALARLHRPPVVPPDLPPSLGHLLRAMTCDDPAGRPSARQCADALRPPRPRPAPDARFRGVLTG